MEPTQSKATNSSLDLIPEELDKLITTGPLHKEGEDLTYKILTNKKKQSLSQYEEGYSIKEFLTQTPKADDIFTEFKALETVTFDHQVVDLLCTDEEVKPFNRYSDILPYKNNPVTLSKDEHGENEYINASYVSSSIKGDNKSFIVCQSPLDSTIIDFWRMVMKEGVHTIVMLCKCKAGNRVQSSEYFPDIAEKDFDHFKRIKLISKQRDDTMDLVTREIELQDGDQTRRVIHYQWEGWPDHGVPDRSQHSVMFYLIRKIRERRSLGPNPAIVHCSAGIGRSGTLVSLYNIAQILLAYNKAKKLGSVDENKKVLSVFSVVRRLREQRFGMVQTSAQYDLIYQLTKEMIENPELLR